VANKGLNGKCWCVVFFVLFPSGRMRKGGKGGRKSGGVKPEGTYRLGKAEAYQLPGKSRRKGRGTGGGQLFWALAGKEKAMESGGKKDRVKNQGPAGKDPAEKRGSG